MCHVLRWSLYILSLQWLKCFWKIGIIIPIMQVWKLRLTKLNRFRKLQSQNLNSFMNFHKDCLSLYIPLKPSSLEHRRSLVNVICSFQVSDETTMFPRKQPRSLTMKLLCILPRNVNSISKLTLWKTSKVLSDSNFQVTSKDHASLNCRLYSAVFSKYFLIANVIDLTVDFPRHISSKLVQYESLFLRKLALWVAVSWEDHAVLIALLIWWRGRKYN